MGVNIVRYTSITQRSRNTNSDLLDLKAHCNICPCLFPGNSRLCVQYTNIINEDCKLLYVGL